MGPRYLWFRIFYSLKTKLGYLEKKFPVNPSTKILLTKSEWIDLKIPFFIPDPNHRYFEPDDSTQLKQKAEKIFNNTFTFFSSTDINFEKIGNWNTNPETGFNYDKNKHWSKIEDFSKSAGDIKYVWEKARFTYIYDIIRYDYHFNVDSSKFIFNQIKDFIEKNPINQGPNYKCSQEISLRTLNWTFALFYYKESNFLTEDLFEKIINVIYWQLQHVFSNIKFSLIAVRNNHAITETAMLYLSYFLFPFIDDTRKWSLIAKKWLLEEIDYQIYDDGSYLQFSHNYHRVIIQVMTWVFRINDLHNISFDKKILSKLKLSLDFLYQHQNDKSGWLPNYGNNDGSLFFPLNNNNYRDFKPQIQALGLLLGLRFYDKIYEDAMWFGITYDQQIKSKRLKNSVFNFNIGGFYGFRDSESFSSIRCGTYKDRPSQADALHLDIWYKDTNVLFDPGTYKYNTEKKYTNFYFGTAGHNTLTIGNHNQMHKGNRFIWFFWTKYAKAEVNEFDDRFEFIGKVKGFSTIEKNIFHKRKIVKHKEIPRWEIVDETNYKGAEKILLHWNISPKINNSLSISAKGLKNEVLGFEESPGWNSELYGKKEEFTQLICSLPDGYAKTIIEISN